MIRFFLIGLLLPGCLLAQECAALWRDKGFSTNSQSQQGIFYQPQGKETYSEFYRRLERSRCYKRWLVVVYMAADNDLEPYAFRDLWEMESALPSTDLDVIVFHDEFKRPGIRYYHIAHPPKRDSILDAFIKFVEEKGVLHLPPKKQEELFWETQGDRWVHSPILKHLSEKDSANPKILGNFLRWALEAYPSEHVLLIGWSHGEGFHTSKKSPQGGFAMDEHPVKSRMPVPALVSELLAVQKEKRNGKRFEISGSDACLNQQWEVAVEWTQASQFLFGSSTMVQKKGFNYRLLLNWLRRHLRETKTDEIEEIARMIPHLYGHSVERGEESIETGLYESFLDPHATMSSWNLDKIIHVQRAMEDLGKNLLEYVEEGEGRVQRLKRWGELHQEFSSAIRVGGVANDFFNWLQVLGTWARNAHDHSVSFDELEQWNRRIRAINNVRRVLRDSMVSYYIGTAYRDGELIRTSQGVATWLPSHREEFQTMFPQFRDGVGYQDAQGQLNDWARFVQFYGKKLVN